MGPARFSVQALDRLDYLIAQLKANGIYVDLNLHVGRSYIPSDGFPESVLRIDSIFDKRVDIYDHRMIELQKQFALNYLSHVNPYTGFSYAADPCVAVVEINNEDSLVGDGDRSDFDFFDKLPEPFHGELIDLWNAWLKRKYRTDGALIAAWSLGALPASSEPPSVFGGSNHPIWTLEDRTGFAKLTQTGGGTKDDPASVQIDSPVKPSQVWQVQALIYGLDLHEDDEYTLSFRARADAERPIRLYACAEQHQAQNDWRCVGLDRVVTLSPDWQVFHLIFRASQVIRNGVRLSIPVGDAAGTVKLSDIGFRRTTIDDIAATMEHQSVENGTVAIPSGGATVATADWHRFLVYTESSYADEMRTFLHRDLGVMSCITDTQVSYGGLSGFAREAGSDYADMHAYWQHPNFPTGRWDNSHWIIRNTPMVSDMADGKVVTFHSLASRRIADKPFSVSEYDHPAPSEFRAEMMPELSTFAALQDWDMIFFFSMERYYSDAGKQDQIRSFFDVTDDPARVTFYPSAAIIFRDSALSPLPAATTLNLAKSSVESSGDAKGEWAIAGKGKPLDIFGSRLQTRLSQDLSAGALTQQFVTRSGSSGARVQHGENGAIYIGQGEKGVAVAGFVGGQSLDPGIAKLTFPPFGNNFAAFTLVSLDTKPLNTSRRLLLTITGKAENLDMGWNADRTSVGKNWGHGPVQAEGIPATVTLANANVKHVWALDPTGARAKAVPVTVAGGAASFTIGPEYRTVWYELGE
ncbi:MAG: hypothetical protein P4L33_18760 [Capsulimonadaceae bacterium]|nr:hypothetical protein [Capsulimonadaceae bacterium]